MKIFLTGASGFIGSAISRELLKYGHEVIGLTHSDEGAASLRAAGIKVQRGNINDLEGLRSGVENSDGIIHCAHMHGFDNIKEASSQEVTAIGNLGRLLLGSKRPLLITSVVAMGIAEPGKPAVETHFDANQHNPRYATETAAADMTNQGINVSVVRLEKAKEKLTTTDLSVSEIAYLLGFEHPQSFTKLFKNKTNMSPLKFRQSFN